MPFPLSVPVSGSRKTLTFETRLKEYLNRLTHESLPLVIPQHEHNSISYMDHGYPIRCNHQGESIILWCRPPRLRMPDRAANREQAHRCVELARESIRSGDLGKAERLLAKSLRLCATDEVKLLLESVRRSGAAREEAKGQQRKQTRKENAAPKKKATATNPEIIGILRKRDYYEILQVRRDCTAVEIKKAYRKVSHP